MKIQSSLLDYLDQHLFNKARINFKNFLPVLNLRNTLRILRSKDGNAKRKIIEALSRQIEKANTSESVTWFRRNTVLLMYDLISGLTDNHFVVFFRSKTVSFLELELDIPNNLLNVVSASCSMNINILQKVPLF